MDRRLVYLAGAITGASYGDSTDWREYAKSKFAPNIYGLSPMRAKDYLQTVGEIKDVHSEFVLSTQKGIMGRDSFDVCRCDMLLVNLLGTTKVSIGTVLELGMAFALNKPIVLVMEKEDNIHEHAMLRETASWRVESVDEAIFVVNAILAEAA